MPDKGVFMLEGDSQLLPELPEGKAENFPPKASPIGAPPPPPVNGVPRFEVVSTRMADGAYKNVEYVDIMIPGNSRSMPRHKVTDRIRDMYRPWYEQWRKGLEMSPVGSPLEMWPVMTPAQVHTLKALNIFTVEQLVEVADANLHQIPMGRTLQNQAKAWLASKKDADAVENYRRKEQAMTDAMRQMEDQITALSKKLESVSSTVKMPRTPSKETV